jgi:hypothetical protein
MFKDDILNWLLPKLIAKKSPRIIPRSGEEAKSVDCFTIYLGNDGKKPTYLVDDYNSCNRELKVLALDANGTFAVEETINLSEALKHTVRVSHYYGLYDLHYINLYDLLFNHITRYDELKVNLHRLWDVITQSRFNKKELVTKDTIELLNFLVSNQLKEGVERPNSWNTSNEGIDVFSLMTELYSLRWVSHPHSNYQMKKLELYLDSLVKAGDLRENNRKFYVTGKALRTLEGYEENERRHKDAVGTQRKIFWLTIIIAFTALIQAKLITLPPIIEWPSSVKQKIEFYLR